MSPTSTLRREAGIAVSAVRRRVPAALVPVVVRRRLRSALADPAMWQRARHEMRFLLGDDVDEQRLDAAARGFIETWVWRSQARWHPRLLTRQRVVGLEHLTAARGAGRGVVLHFMHHGQYDGAFASLSRLGVPCHVVINPKMTRRDAPEHLKQHARVGAVGTTLVPTTAGYAGLVEVVASGGVLALATDVPGSTEVTFAGRPVLGSSGAARIARETGAPVVGLTTRVDALGQHLRLAPAVDPSAYGSVGDLLRVMVSHQEEAVLITPHLADSPRSRWTELDPAGRAG